MRAGVRAVGGCEKACELPRPVGRVGRGAQFIGRAAVLRPALDLPNLGRASRSPDGPGSLPSVLPVRGVFDGEPPSADGLQGLEVEVLLEVLQNLGGDDALVAQCDQGLTLDLDHQTLVALRN